MTGDAASSLHPNSVNPITKIGVSTSHNAAIPVQKNISSFNVTVLCYGKWRPPITFVIEIIESLVKVDLQCVAWSEEARLQ